MKTEFKILTVLFVILTSCVIYPGSTSGQVSTVSFQVFYDQLSPYGQWVDDDNYGYVWIPDSGSDFVPYSSDGHWILTDYGWTWASDYIWGWATFHYGCWSFNDSFGWFWVPDNEWGPAWVNWREADGYYGWEPMEPGMSISMSFDRRYDSNNDHWLFVSNHDFERTDINHYYVNRTDRDRIVRNSTIINNTYLDNTRRATYVSGPSRIDVQRNTGRIIVPSYIIRSAPANANDSKFCGLLAQNAVHAAMAGKTDFVVGHWNHLFTLLPIPIAIAKQKRIDMNDELWWNVLETTGQPVNMKNS
jgi:hypothetical protein